MDTVIYEGEARPVVGELHYPEAPEPGTLLGRNVLGRACVALATVVEDGRAVTLIGLAGLDDVKRAAERIAQDGPRSLVERTMPGVVA